MGEFYYIIDSLAKESHVVAPVAAVPYHDSPCQVVHDPIAGIGGSEDALLSRHQNAAVVLVLVLHHAPF